MARLMRTTSVLIIVWIIGFYVYLYQNKTALFLSGYESDAHNEMYIGSHNVGDIDIRTDVDNTDAILQRIVASDAGNFSYVSSDNVGVLDPSRGRFTDVDNYLKNKEYGYFLEIGTEGNEPASVTFLLERTRGWTGLVIEPHSEQFIELMYMKRNSKFLKACLQTKVGVWPAYDDGHVSRDLPCFRLGAILKTLQHDRIDLLLVDAIEEATPLLESFPFNYINVTLICIEFHGTNVYVTPMIEKLKKKDFESIKIMTNHVYQRTDVLFVNNKLK